MPFAGKLAGDLVSSRNVLFLSSGRAALWLALKAASRLQPDRLEVVVPAYTCPAVVSAILKAGLRPVLCDIHLGDFGYVLEELSDKISDRTLAVIAVHLFGYPCALGQVMDLARRRGVWVIEDAAQAFGNPPICRNGSIHRPGFQADAGFFSFGRGKPLSILHGGILVTSRQDLYNEALRIYENLRPYRGLETLKYAAYLVAYWLFWRPSLYWLPQRAPFLHLGETLFEEDFQVRQGLSGAERVLVGMIASLEKETQARSATAAWYSEHLSDLCELSCPLSSSYPYLRYPLVAATNEIRDRILSELGNRGFTSAVFYPSPLNELPGLREVLQDARVYPNARILSRRLVALPLHTGLSAKDRTGILEAIRKACGALPSSEAPNSAGAALNRVPTTREAR